MKTLGILVSLGAALFTLFLLSLALGSVQIPLEEVVNILLDAGAAGSVWQRIILDFRLPKAITAMVSGAALAVSGLQMQTLFRNALAGPFILGISSGAGLGVALMLLAAGTVFPVAWIQWFDFYSEFTIVTAAVGGAVIVFLVVAAIAHRVQDHLALLIVGLMLSYVASGFISVLMYFSESVQIQTYMLWTFGSFRGVTWSQLRALLPSMCLGLLLAGFLVKSLNALLLGEAYAGSMGIHVGWARKQIIFSTAVLAGGVTAFCGPIGFIDIAVPHICRGLFRTSDHRILIPAVALAGSNLALLAELATQLPGSQQSLPLNAITALFGAPIVIWVVLSKRIQY